MTAETQTDNPYTPPPAASAAPVEDFCDVPIVSYRGRLGRVRYIGYLMALNVLTGVVFGVLGAVAGAMPETLGSIVLAILVALLYAGMVVLMVFWTIRRVHDCNLSGWFTLLFIIPLINIAIWLVPGTQG